MTRHLARGLACVALAVAPSIVRAAAFDYDWNGGSGTWNTSTARWAHNQSGVYDQTYISGGFNAFFGLAGSPGTVTMAQSLNALSVKFFAGGYTIDLAGFTLTATTLIPFGSTAFDFGSTSSHATFTDSSGQNWLGVALAIDDYVAGTSVLQIGTSAGGLTAPQLSDIVFAGYTNGGAAQIDSNGFVTPTGVSAIPEPSTYAFILGFLALGAAGMRHFFPKRRGESPFFPSVG